MLLHFTNISKQDITIPLETGALKSISLLHMNDTIVIEVQWTDKQFKRWRYSSDIMQICGDPESYVKKDTRVVLWMLQERPKSVDQYIVTTAKA